MNTVWILLLFTHVYAGVQQVEFADKDACWDALQKIQTAAKANRYGPRAITGFCVPKAKQ